MGRRPPLRARIPFGISADSPWRISPFCPSLLIRFIIVDMSSNCFSSRLTSCTDVPEPAAMRFLRLALMISGARRSFGVIERMIAACRFSIVVSSLASSICCFILPMPGSIPRMPDRLPILPICLSWLA